MHGEGESLLDQNNLVITPIDKSKNLCVMTENQYGETISDVFSYRDKFEPIEYNSESVCNDKVKLRKEIH